MPRYGLDKLLDDAQITDVAEYVLSLSGKSTDPAAAGTWPEGLCRAVRRLPRPRRQGQAGTGRAQPDGRHLALRRQQAGHRREHQDGRGGMMPAWVGRLDPVTLKSLAVYVHSLGGGK